MNPNVRSAILIAGLTILVFFSLLIVALLGVAIWGAINGPDDRR